MPEQIISHQDVRDENPTYSDVLHALNEYRLWRDNVYIGKELGPARAAYVGILKQRVRETIEDYKSSRAREGRMLTRAA